MKIAKKRKQKNSFKDEKKIKIGGKIKAKQQKIFEKNSIKKIQVDLDSIFLNTFLCS
jgi:hypothetical protein